MDSAIRFSANVKLELGEIFLAIAYENSMIGLEELESDATSINYLCYYTTEEDAKSAKNILKSEAISLGEVETIINQDWNAKWRETIESVKVSSDIWVSPDWLTPKMSDGDHWIKIEPRMAFGTGHHETTRLASQMVVESAKNGGKSFLDIGTGSGILSFVADYSGYNDIVGIEIDPDCKINLQENLEANKSDSNIEFIIGSVDDLPKERKFDTVVMNIIRTYSEPLLEKAINHLNKDGAIIWSGILAEERDRVVTFAEDSGCKLIYEKFDGEWWAGNFEVV